MKVGGGPVIDFPEKQDIQRLLYLYSEIQEENLNEIPADIIEFWKNAILQYSLQTGLIRFTIEDLQQSFMTQSIIPISIITVSKVLEKELAIIDEERLLTQSSLNDENLVISLLSSLWSFGSSLIQSTEAVEKQKLTKIYLNTSIFSEIHKCVIRYFNENKQSDKSFNGFLTLQEPNSQFNHSLHFLINRAVEHCYGSDKVWKQFMERFNDHDIMVHYLAQQGLWKKVDDKIVQIKFLSKASSVASSSSTSQTSLPGQQSDEVALAKFRIQLSLHQVTTSIEHMQQKVNFYYKQALEAKKIGNDSQALLKLKMKKNTTETQKRLFQAQYSLEEALHNLETSHLNTTIINAYQIATSGLKKSREESGLSIESVDEVMEEFQNEMDELKAIDEVFDGHQSSQFSAEDEEALSHELEELLKEGETPQTEELLFPQVPSHVVISVQSSLPSEEDRNETSQQAVLSEI